MSNFFFSHSVFKRLELQAGENKGLFGKEWMTHSNNVSYPYDRKLHHLHHNDIAVCKCFQFGQGY